MCLGALVSGRHLSLGDTSIWGDTCVWGHWCLGDTCICGHFCLWTLVSGGTLNSGVHSYLGDPRVCGHLSLGGHLTWGCTRIWGTLVSVGHTEPAVQQTSTPSPQGGLCFRSVCKDSALTSGSPPAPCSLQPREVDPGLRTHSAGRGCAWKRLPHLCPHHLPRHLSRKHLLCFQGERT